MDRGNLAFAYRYPFSEEAKGIVSRLQVDPRDLSRLRMSRARIEEDLGEKPVAYRDMDYGQLDSLIGYALSRLMVSPLPEYAIQKYADAEARRSVSALASDTEANIAKVAGELGIDVHADEDFFVDVVQFLANCPPGNEYALVNQRLSGGVVSFDKHGMCGMLHTAISRRVRSGLPVSRKDIPKEVLQQSKEIKLPTSKARRYSGNSLSWIDRLLSNPIPDIRKRVVYLVLAPYLVNIRGMDVEEACRTIAEYIDRCKAIDPSTRITSQQIRYFCNYAKARELKPLSLQKARELLSPVIDL